MSTITIQAAGATSVVASWNPVTEQIGFQVSFPNGATVFANASNLAVKIQDILTTGYLGTTYFTDADLDAVRSFQADISSVISQANTAISSPTTIPAPTNTQAPTVQNDTPATISGPTGTPYDDDGFLNPGWTLNENNDPVYVGGGFVEPSTVLSADASSEAARGLTGPVQDARSQATRQDVSAFQASGDWRVRLKLAAGATYLYKAKDPGILLPLTQSDGVIFPYTPQIQIAYTANYDPHDLTHSNYKIFQYRNSAVDQISITCDFTAQDTFEANYLLAVIHFFKTVTKMFYGQDENPKTGVPPPLCYITGLGSFQFDNHPIAITSFNYTLPTDVDYIRASSISSQPGVNLSEYVPRSTTASSIQNRLGSLQPGAQKAPPAFQLLSSKQPTYVPTKMSIQISAIPIVSRNDISNRLSLKDYATGKLIQGSKNKSGGIW